MRIMIRLIEYLHLLVFEMCKFAKLKVLHN